MLNFPSEFDVHRKDRIGKGGGRVLLATHSKFMRTCTVNTVVLKPTASDCGPGWKWKGTKIYIHWQQICWIASTVGCIAITHVQYDQWIYHPCSRFQHLGETNEVPAGATTLGETRKLLAIWMISDCTRQIQNQHGKIPSIYLKCT